MEEDAVDSIFDVNLIAGKVPVVSLLMMRSMYLIPMVCILVLQLFMCYSIA